MNTIVLLSGGVESAVLAAHEAQTAMVHPVYVGVGFAWEAAELAMIGRLLQAPIFSRRVRPVLHLSLTMAEVYPSSHWAIRGVPPDYDTPDEDVYLVGRNLMLLSRAAVVAVAKNSQRIALGTLAGNPFADARPAFFSAMAEALSLGLDHPIAIGAPFITHSKGDVIKMGVDLGVPLELTWSCIKGEGAKGATSTALPVHCGLCSKCRERRDGFAAAGIVDPTTYAHRSPR